jgi:phospholipid/cholesterol/gamma-HCH transport system substrate-binding protein
MITRAQRIRLGIFVLVSLVTLLSLLVAVLGSSLFADRDSYEIRYDISVSGLEIGAPVKYNGVRVGRVERIWIDPLQVSRTLVSISLQARTPVKRNTKAVLNIQGITGLKFIELVGGTSDADTLPPGSVILPGESVVDKLTGQAETLALKAEMLINQLTALTGSDNQGLVADLLERTGSLAVTLDKTVEENRAGLQALVESLQGASTRLSAALEEIRLAARDTREAVTAVRRRAEGVLDAGRVAGLLDEGKALVGDLRKRAGPSELGQVIETLQSLSRRTDALVEKLDMVVSRSREDLRTSLRFLAEATDNFREFSRLIREDPSRLLRAQEKRGRDLP